MLSEFVVISYEMPVFHENLFKIQSSRVESSDKRQNTVRCCSLVL